MAKLNDKMKEMLAKELPFVSTVNNDAQPNIGPKRSLRLYDDETLIYNENTGKKTMANIQANGKISVAIADWGKLDGYRFEGTAEVFESGPLYDECVEWAKGKMQVPLAAVLIKIETIYTLKSGPTAGNKISE